MKRKTVFDYLSLVMMHFGVSMLVINIFCVLFGDNAKEFSTLFELGGAGISVKTALEFFALNMLIIAARFVFFTDLIFKKFPLVCRTVCLVTAVIALTGVFIAVFGWFPINSPIAWAMFFVCFVISFLASWFVTSLKEKAENKKLAEALERLKEKNR